MGEGDPAGARVAGRVDTPGDGRALATDEQLTLQDSSLDWQVWPPSSGRDQEFQTERDF